MQASLPLLLNAPVRREVKPRAATFGSASRLTGRKIIFHPRYRNWLVRMGLDTPDAVLALPGEIVCGHPDRHVVRVELGTGGNRRIVYLKREHVVGWKVRLKNARADFGWVSRSEREAETLRRLEAAGLPGPQWLAYGTDGRGRAFLLVDEVADADDLLDVLNDSELSTDERRLLAERIGRAVAELHEAGFGTPELAAKHVLIGRKSAAVTLIDWQTASRGSVSVPDRVRQLAGLAASLPDGTVTESERFRFLWAYLRVVRGSRRAGEPLPRFGILTRSIQDVTETLRNRSSSRNQRHAAANPQRLVWLAGEEVCIIPELADVWPTPAAGPPFYPNPTGPKPAPVERIELPNGRPAVLARFSTSDPLGRLWAAFRGKPWRSPGATAGRLLFHLERYGIPAPRLLAFGQRLTSPVRADSFVVYEPRPDSESLSPDELTAKLRSAGCEWAAGPRPTVDSPFAVRLSRRGTR